MAWIQRGDKQLYYRSVSVGGRPRKQYLGAGPAAQLAASGDQQQRALRATERQGLQATQLAEEHAGNLIHEAGQWTEMMVQAALLLAGFHQHDRGNWRRRRNAH